MFSADKANVYFRSVKFVMFFASIPKHSVMFFASIPKHRISLPQESSVVAFEFVLIGKPTIKNNFPRIPWNPRGARHKPRGTFLSNHSFRLACRQQEKQVRQFVTESAARIAGYQEELAKWDVVPSFDQMTMEEFRDHFPDLVSHRSQSQVTVTGHRSQ